MEGAHPVYCEDEQSAKQEQEKQLLCLAPPVSLLAVLLPPQRWCTIHLELLQQMRPVLCV